MRTNYNTAYEVFQDIRRSLAVALLKRLIKKFPNTSIAIYKGTITVSNVARKNISIILKSRTLYMAGYSRMITLKEFKSPSEVLIYLTDIDWVEEKFLKTANLLSTAFTKRAIA